jgi:hypothetical protein
MNLTRMEARSSSRTLPNDTTGRGHVAPAFVIVLAKKIGRANETRPDLEGNTQAMANMMRWHNWAVEGGNGDGPIAPIAPSYQGRRCPSDGTGLAKPGIGSPANRA